MEQKYRYRLYYLYDGKERMFVTFETNKPLDSVQELSFGNERSICGIISSKALDHPRGGCIYRFHVPLELEFQIKKWFQKIHAKNILWHNSIYIPLKLNIGHKLQSKIFVGTHEI